MLYHRAGRYGRFDNGGGARFERGELGLAALRDLAVANGEPARISGGQEWYENVISQYL